MILCCPFIHDSEADGYQKLDAQLLEDQEPIDVLDREHRTSQTELNAKLSQAQQVAQELSRNADKFEGANKQIER
jgi:hypothetical protein